MPFTLIKGSFRPKAPNARPDGDSVRFRADDLSLWAKLDGAPVALKGPDKDQAQLRLEGIDAIESAATRPLAIEARDNLFALLGFDANTSPEPRGYVLARMTDDQSKRPICFAFAGNPDKPDGSDVFLDRPLLRKSANYKQVRDGFAYPLYYNTLFSTLRAEFNGALKLARNANRGQWPRDKTLSGVTVTGHGDLATIAPIWPKLWRRLDDFLRDGAPLADFVDDLAGKNERLNIISIAEERGLQDIVDVTGSKVKLTVAPEDIQVIGKAGQRKR